MSKKNTLMALSTALFLNGCGNDVQQNSIPEITTNTQQELIESIQSEYDSPLYDSIDFPAEENRCDTVIISELKNSPLFMPGTKRHIGEFLGYNQYKTILEKYNKGRYDEEKFNEDKSCSINNFDTIIFPLIYDGLDSVLPSKIEDLISKQEFENFTDKLGTNNDLIVIMENQGKHILGYYKNGILFLATHVSIGVNNTTPKGVFTTGLKIPKNISRKYNNAPMPYTIVIVGNICFHQGKVTGDQLSHGCLRVPGLFQSELYKHIEPGTTVIVF